MASFHDFFFHGSQLEIKDIHFTIHRIDPIGTEESMVEIEIAYHIQGLTAIYQMLSTGEEWSPSDLYKIDIPVALLEKQKAKALNQAKKLLLREGVITESQLVLDAFKIIIILILSYSRIAYYSAPNFS